VNVLIKKSAFKSIEQIADYIALEIKMPETALRYADKLIAFGYDLGKHYKLYTPCKNIKLAKQGLRCATFDKKWVFAYKIGNNSVIIHHIVWAGILK
jgi:hypothetical protein